MGEGTAGVAVGGRFRFQGFKVDQSELARPVWLDCTAACDIIPMSPNTFLATRDISRLCREHPDWERPAPRGQEGRRRHSQHASHGSVAPEGTWAQRLYIPTAGHGGVAITHMFIKDKIEAKIKSSHSWKGSEPAASPRWAPRPPTRPPRVSAAGPRRRGPGPATRQLPGRVRHGNSRHGKRASFRAVDGTETRSAAELHAAGRSRTPCGRNLSAGRLHEIRLESWPRSSELGNRAVRPLVKRVASRPHGGRGSA